MVRCKKNIFFNKTQMRHFVIAFVSSALCVAIHSTTNTFAQNENGTEYISSVVYVVTKHKGKELEAGSAVVIQKRTENKRIVYTLATARHVIEKNIIGDNFSIKKKNDNKFHPAKLLQPLPYKQSKCNNTTPVYKNRNMYRDISCRYDIALLEVSVNNNTDPKFDVLPLELNKPVQNTPAITAGFPGRTYEESQHKIIEVRSIGSKGEDGPFFEGQTIITDRETIPGQSGGALIDEKTRKLIGITVTGTEDLIIHTSDELEYRFKNPNTMKVYDKIDEYKSKTFSVSVLQLCDLWKSTHLKHACTPNNTPVPRSIPSTAPKVTRKATSIAQPSYVRIIKNNKEIGLGFIFKKHKNNFYIATAVEINSLNKTIIKTSDGIVLRSINLNYALLNIGPNKKTITVILASTHSNLKIERICNPLQKPDKNKPCILYIPEENKEPTNPLYAQELCKIQMFRSECKFPVTGVL